MGPESWGAGTGATVAVTLNVSVAEPPLRENEMVLSNVYGADMAGIPIKALPVTTFGPIEFDARLNGDVLIVLNEQRYPELPCCRRRRTNSSGFQRHHQLADQSLAGSP